MLLSSVLGLFRWDNRCHVFSYWQPFSKKSALFWKPLAAVQPDEMTLWIRRLINHFPSLTFKLGFEITDRLTCRVYEWKRVLSARRTAEETEGLFSELCGALTNKFIQLLCSFSYHSVITAAVIVATLPYLIDLGKCDTWRWDHVCVGWAGGQLHMPHVIEDKPRCQSTPSTLFEVGSLVHCCVHQAGWAANFKGLSCVHLASAQSAHDRVQLPRGSDDPNLGL